MRFKEIIDGKTVTAVETQLVFGGVDVSNVFVDEFNKKKYLPATVADIKKHTRSARSGVLY